MFYKSRRKTTDFDQFCFREGLKTSTEVRTARRWLPIVAIFQMQMSFLKPGCFLFYSSAGTGGHAEFLARRLKEYQRTLRVIHGRVRESVQENQLTQDLERLMQVIGTSSHSLATLYSEKHYFSYSAVRRGFGSGSA